MIRTSYAVYLGVLVCSLLTAGSVCAATDDFTVQMQFGDDTTPPSAPASLTATPVSVSQIDLAWATSSDNIGVGGYQVFRDGAQIATTTNTAYSNTGLLEDTLYAYYVTAFDAAGNVSASSTVVATTTLAPAPTSSPPSAPEGGSAPQKEMTPLPLELTSLEIVVGTTTATFIYETRGYMRTVLKWGQTELYEKGSLSERYFRKTHSTTIRGLIPDTTYRFALEGENHLGRYGTLSQDSFTTLPVEEQVFPENVRGLSATIDGTDVVLSWENPRSGAFDRVRLIRNERFYPSDEVDGWLVYEGEGTRVRDEGAAVPGTTQYYTAFTYTDDGQISSGAIVAVAIGDEAPTPFDEPREEPDPDDDRVEVTFDDLEFTQGRRTLTPADAEVLIDGTQPLTVSLDTERVPETLTTVIVTVYESSAREREFSFLLRKSDSGDAYEAHIAPLGVSGTFPVVVSVFDFNAERVEADTGTIRSQIAFYPEDDDESAPGMVIGWIQSVNYLPLFVGFLVLMLLGAFRLIRGSTAAA